MARARTRSRRFAERCVEAGVLDERRASRSCDEKADAAVDEAVEFADASPEPALDSLYDDLYVLGDQVQGWYAVDERTPEPHRGEHEARRPAARARAGRGGRRLRRAAGRRRGQAAEDGDAEEATEPEVADERRGGRRLMADAALSRGAATTRCARRCGATRRSS